jgi:Mn2+/Fe2+ NRAMP family transporter
MPTTATPERAAATPHVERPPDKLLEMLGPGLITGASDDDPSGIATYSQAGAELGYGASWTLVLTYPLMVGIQMISAELGRTTGRGIAGNIRQMYAGRVVAAIVVPLVVANVINLGADLGAMADALRLLIGGPTLIYVAVFAVACAATQVFVEYDRYVSILKWLTLALFAYVATLFFVHIDVAALAKGLVWPKLTGDARYFSVIVAIFGTTISPYLFFWQASEEVEDLKENATQAPLVDAPEQAPAAARRIRLDTMVGMGFSNLIALAIMVATAATLHMAGVTDIESSSQAAEALKPVAGAFAQTLFALGIVGTGLLAVPVLAGSSAYAIGEAMGWPTGLSWLPRRAPAFYGALVVATLVGAALNFTAVNPIAALFWSAVINGVVAVPVMVIMMLMATSTKIMGTLTIGPVLTTLGWVATGVMALSVLGMIATSVM